MFAINHAATALIFKKRYPEIKLVWLLLCVQLVEYLWVIFNYLGLEMTTTEIKVNYIGDIHLAFMPFSHSLLTTIFLSLSAFFIIKFFFKKRFAMVISLAIASHFLLDLLVHAQDLPLWYFTTNPLLGTNLYRSLPYLAFIIESFFGIFCWWYYEGSKMLLSVIVIFNLLNFTTFSPHIVGLEKYFANQPILLVSVILTQILATSFFVWFYARRRMNIRFN